VDTTWQDPGQAENYIHMNPVVAGLVEKPEHYLYSSAKDYHATMKCGLLDFSPPGVLPSSNDNVDE
jgi:hypothetical protein